MLTNKQIKLINSLHTKKGRNENQLFLVEGQKAIQELLKSSFSIEFIVLNDSVKDSIDFPTIVYTPEDLIQKLTTLVNNTYGFAVVSNHVTPYKFDFTNQITLVLDGVRDPGNLGTIIRICDWYDVKQLILSDDCTDFYNPKVVAASMGSFARVHASYVDLASFLKEQSHLPILGAFLDGESIHSFSFPQTGFIVFGNESNGIRPEIEVFINRKITIPRYGNAESLNVGISTAVILDNLRR